MLASTIAENETVVLYITINYSQALTCMLLKTVNSSCRLL